MTGTITRLTVLVLTASAVSASECKEVSQSVSFRTATVVFSGTPIRIESLTEEAADPTDKVQLQRPLDGDPKVITFSTERFWKGAPRKTVKVFLFLHPRQGQGYSFKLGGQYVVYATESVSKWAPLHAVIKDEPVFEVGECPLRIRTDIDAETRLLSQRTMVPR